MGLIAPRRPGAGPGQDAARYHAEVGRCLQQLPPARFPAVVALQSHLMTGGRDARFAYGPDLIVRGLAAHAAGAEPLR